MDLLQENAVAAARTDCPVVDLEKEDMMVQERGTDAGDVVDLTEILPPKSDAGAPAGEEATDVQASCERFCGTEQEESTGGMDDPSCQILGGIAAMEQALASQDSPAMLSAAENMISIAGAYGMRYLEDMALCVRDACTAGDLSGTSLVVKDMRAELERYMRQ